jgi:cytochrome c-type biogenesis protein CcmH/NrfF
MTARRNTPIWALLATIAMSMAIAPSLSAKESSAVAPQVSSAVTAQAPPTASAPAPAATISQRADSGRGPTVRHPEAVEAISRVKSPYCPGLMLEVCPSGGGIALRDTIEGLAEDGWSADSIVNWILANHGDTLLALPPVQGKGLIAWIVPPLAVAAGLSLVLVALRRMRRVQPAVELGDDLTPDQKRELETALQEMEAEEQTPLF